MSSSGAPAVLMVTPDHYKIEYAINPFMLDKHGQLRKVDAKKAREQWQDLVNLYKKIGVQVHVLEGQNHLPDMVYAANNALLFKHPKTGKNTALMARMKSSFRQPELSFFEKWYAEYGYCIEHLQSEATVFEGCGDGLFQNRSLTGDKPILWGGYGHRSEKKVYDEIAQRFGFQVIPLELIHKDFYHLDTCFAILNDETVAVQKQAFKAEDFATIKKEFKNVIEVALDESLNRFANNCFCPNGRDIIVQSGSPGFTASAEKLGFKVRAVETGEFMHGGGSVFCLKMALV